MQIKESFLTKNDCYVSGKRMVPTAIMVHSTATPGIMAADWISRWNKPDISKCVHAFVDDKEIIQTLPWEMVGWHSGVGSLGKKKNANNTGYIGFEICEPAGHGYSGGTITNYNVEKNAEYFSKAYNNAVDLCVYLCKAFSIKPEKIVCHSEGNKMGIASNHSDVMQWFPLHGKSMDTFRNDVREKLGEKESKMRYFKLKEDMNIRLTPNGTKLGVAPENAVISGSELRTHNGVEWLKTTYNGISGYIAVLPASRNYAVEIEPETTDQTNYESLYLEEKTRADELADKIKRVKEILG